MDKWDFRFMNLAETVSSWSKDEHTKVGSVIASHNKIISVGYNGFPANIDDDERLSNRDIKNKLMIHAESNAIHQANKNNTQGSNYKLYCTMFPCLNCAKQIVQYGRINKIISYKPSDEYWIKYDMEIAYGLFKESGILVEWYHEPWRKAA